MSTRRPRNELSAPRGAVAAVAQLIGLQGFVAILAMFVLSRLVAVSDYSGATTLAVVNALGIPGTLTGAAVQVVPMLLVLAATSVSAEWAQLYVASRYALSSSSSSSSSQRRLVTPYAAAAAILWLLVFLTVPSPVSASRPVAIGTFVFAFSALALVALKAWRGTPRGLPGETSWGVRTFLTGALLLAVIQVVWDNAMWLPAERISILRAALPTEPQQTQDGAPQPGLPSEFVGYVLRSDENWTAVMLDRPRLVIQLRTREMVARDVCSINGGLRSQPLLRLRSQTQPFVVPNC